MTEKALPGSAEPASAQLSPQRCPGFADQPGLQVKAFGLELGYFP
jgi:hypothetical protein